MQAQKARTRCSGGMHLILLQHPDLESPVALLTSCSKNLGALQALLDHGRENEHRWLFIWGLGKPNSFLSSTPPFWGSLCRFMWGRESG